LEEGRAGKNCGSREPVKTLTLREIKQASGDGNPAWKWEGSTLKWSAKK